MSHDVMEQARAALQSGTVIETSGSTGVPKRVALSATALRASAEATAARVGAGQWVLALPATYVAGLQVIVRSILADTEPVVIEGGFTAQAFAEATAQARAQAVGRLLLTSLVPAQIATLLDDADGARALAAFDTVLVGGQALPEPVRLRAVEHGAHLVRTYGSSETSGGCIYDGVPLDGVQVRIVADELQVGGPMLADGYLGDAALTEACFTTDADGTRWFRTGDLGEVVDGVVRVLGRADNVIISGGINVSLDRVERVVRGVRGLEHAVVLGVADERWGEASVIIAAIDAHNADAALKAARGAVADQIGTAARPSRLIVVDEIPLLSSGKPNREALRTQLAPRL